MPNAIDYERLFPWQDRGAEYQRAVSEIRARVAGGAIPLEFTIGLFPGDVRDYEAGLEVLPGEVRALAIAAVESAIYLRPAQIREAAHALAGVIVRDTEVPAESVAGTVEPLLSRDDSAPPGTRPSDPLVRRRLDLIANLRAGVMPPEDDGNRTETLAMYLPQQQLPENPVEWGRFRELRPIGAHGFFQALDPEGGLEVALKLVRPGYEAWSSEPALLHRARMLAGVRHPGLVPLTGAEARDGRVGWWCDWIGGTRATGPFDAFEAARMVAELCGAVSAIHATGLPHGEIRAENVVLRGAEKAPLLMPFGPGGEQPPYAAPEFRMGAKPSRASDVYALGAMLPVLVQGTTWPAGLSEIVNRATAYLPEARYRGVDEMRLALAAFAATGRKPAWRWLVPALCAAVVMTAVGFTVSRWFGGVESEFREAHELLARPEIHGSLEKAASLLEKAVRAKPDDAAAHADLSEAYLRRFRESPEAALRERAITNANRALELDPHSADAWRQVGEVRASAGNPANAGVAYRRAIDLNPNDWRNYYAWGRFLAEANRIVEAKEQFGNALRVSPENAVVLGGLGAAQEREKDYPAAVATLRRAMEAAPGDAAACRNLGELYTLLGEFDPAAEVMEKATRIAAGDYRNWEGLAVAGQYGSGGPAKVRAAWKKALELAREEWRNGRADAEILADLGILQAETGNLTAGKGLLKQAAELRADSPEVLFRAGLGYEILGDREQALRLIPEAVRRGYPAEVVRRRPELARLRDDARFRLPE